MLSIKNITSSAVAASYFEKDDYYANKDNGPDAAGVWFGRGSDALGLTGAVDSDTFKSMLDGKMPDGTQLGTVRERGGDKEHKPGWDLTFSAPKSVSVMSLVGGDQRLVAAHGEAVREALSWAEKNLAGHRTRHWVDGLLGSRREARHELSGNMAFALFQHATSREKDPQLHTHAVTLNATQAADGHWRSLNSKPLYDYKMALGNIYRAALAERVQQLGYRIDRTGVDGTFELATVPTEVTKEFSTRSQQIREAMAERGLEGAEDAARAALMTRPSKTVSPLAELIPEWQARGLRLQFDAAEALSAAEQAGPQQPQGPAVTKQSIREAVSRLADKEAVFSHAQLLQWSLAGAIGRDNIAGIEAGLNQAIAGGDILDTSLRDAKAFTTPAARHQEKKLLDLWRGSRAITEPAYDRKAANLALLASGLNEGQTRGAAAILTQTDRYIAIEGRPGVGKTHTLGVVARLLESRGLTVKGMAGNANAARTLQEDAKIPSGTIKRHLARANKDLIALAGNDKAAAQSVLARTSREVWVLDEASQIGARGMTRLMSAAAKLKARVVMVGDTRQLSAIDAGKPFEQLIKAGIDRTEIDQNMRQRNARHKQAVHEAVRGKVHAAMTTLSAETVQIENRDKRLQAIVSTWAQLGELRSRTTVLTARNAERIELNDLMRGVLREEGKLAGETSITALSKVYAERMDKVNASTYKPDDLVVFARGQKSLGIKPGVYYRVSGVDAASNTLNLQPAESAGSAAQTPITWNPRTVAGGAHHGVTLYRDRPTSLAPAERIQWSANMPSLKLSDGTSLTNGQMLTVQAIDEQHLRLLSTTGAQITLDRKQLASGHWDHADATTVYKSQGRTEDVVLVNAEANQTALFNQKAFVVALSRQRDTIKLFTDDTERFTANVDKNKGDKTTVADSRKEKRESLLSDGLRQMLDRYAQDAAQKRAENAKTRERNDSGVPAERDGNLSR